MPVSDEPTTLEPTPLPTIIEVEPTQLPTPEPTHVAELTCSNTGGKIGKADCCLFVDDFVSFNTCCLCGYVSSVGEAVLLFELCCIG